MKKILLINIITVLIIFAFIEIVIRLGSNITTQGLSEGIINTSKEPVFNFPNIKGKRVFGEEIFTDMNGYRIEINDRLKKEQNSEKIYFVGGSVTFGSGVKQSDTFSGILNKKFINFDIINSSVVGSNLINNFHIINLISQNDLRNIFINFSLDDLSGLDEILNESEVINHKKNNINDNKLLNNSLTFKLKNNFLIVEFNKFIRSKSATYVWLKGYFLNSQENYYNHALLSFKNKENLIGLNKVLNDIIQLNNSKFEDKIVFLNIPYSHQITNGNCKKQDIAEKIIHDYLKKSKIELVKFKKVFCNDKNKEKIFLKFDPSHLSPYGHRLVSKILEERIN